MGLSSPGIGSNLDVNGIVSQLMSVESRRLTKMQVEEASYQSKLSAYGQVKGAMSTFQSAMTSLSSVAQFQPTTVTPSDAAIMTASATSIATPGTYSLEVTRLAQAQKLATAGQLSTATPIGAGTITFDFGTIIGGTRDADGKYTGASFKSNGNGVKTVTIDPTNNSLSGIRDAINTAAIGVTATIVNDGGDTPYRLVLSDKTTGAENSMKISVAGDGGLSSLLSHNPGGDVAAQALKETIKAQNAEFTIDGLTVSKQSNIVTDVIAGLTINLAKPTAGTPTTLTVARDTSSVVASVNKFVNSFNALNKALTDASSYNKDTKLAGPLNGDSAVRSAQAGLRSVLASAVQGGYGEFDRLSQIGVSFQKDGTLGLDSAKLNKALASNFNDVAGLFASAGKATDSLVSFTGSTSATKPGAYPVNVTKMATQAQVTGKAAAQGLTITPGNNDLLTVTINGLTADITLAGGTYASNDALAAEIQSKINGNSTFAGLAVKVTQTAAKFSIATEMYGKDASIAVSGGAASDYLFGGVPDVVLGTDVEGTINGQPAKGLAQTLYGNEKDASAGIQVIINGGTTGERGTVNFSRGYAALFSEFADGVTGAGASLSSRTQGLDRSVAALRKQQEAETKRLTTREENLRKQFTALDTKLSALTNTSNYLAQQLAQIANLNVG